MLFCRLWLIPFFIFTTAIFAQNWQIEPVDSARPGGFIYDSSIDSDTCSYPHIVYPLYPLLKYAKWNGNAWEFQRLDSVGLGGFNTAKLSFSYEGWPRVAYLMQYPLYYFKVKYAYWNGISWQIDKIDSFYTGSYYQSCFQNQRNIDMTLNHNGIPYVSYSFIKIVDSIWGIRCAYKDSDSWIVTSIWQRPIREYVFPFRARIALDSTELPTVAFIIRPVLPQETCQVVCAHFDGGAWQIEQVDSYYGTGAVYLYSMKIDRTNRTHLLYFIDYIVHYALKQNSIWNIEDVGNNDQFLSHGDLALDRNNTPHIVYSATMQPLTYGYKTGTVWHHEIIEPSFPGCLPSIAIDSQGNNYVSYIRGSNLNKLYNARRIAPGVEENRPSLSANRFSLEVYPNPAKTYFTIRLPHNAQSSTLRIFDVSGKIVKSEELKGKSTRISLEGIKNGVYFVKVGNELIKEKLVVTR